MYGILIWRIEGFVSYSGANHEQLSICIASASLLVISHAAVRHCHVDSDLTQIRYVSDLGLHMKVLEI